MDLDFPPIVEPDEPTIIDEPRALATVEAKPLDFAKIDLNALALARFGPWREAVDKVTKTLDGVAHDFSTQAKIDEGKSLRQRLINRPLADARAVEKDTKSKLSRASKAVGAELALIEAEYGKAEQLITPQIDAAQAKIDEAKEAARQAEANRIRKHELTLETLRGYAEEAKGKHSAAIRRGIDALTELPIAPEVWEEFYDRAVDTKAATIAALWRLHDEAKQREEEAARAAAEAERVEAQRIENERIAAELAAQRAEIERQAADLRRQQEEAQARQQAEENTKRKAQQQADLNQSYEAAVIRCGEAQVRALKDTFVAHDRAGRIVPDEHVDAYIVALKALQPQEPAREPEAAEAGAHGASEAPRHEAVAQDATGEPAPGVGVGSGDPERGPDGACAGHGSGVDPQDAVGLPGLGDEIGRGAAADAPRVILVEEPDDNEGGIDILAEFAEFLDLCETGDLNEIRAAATALRPLLAQAMGA